MAPYTAISDRIVSEVLILVDAMDQTALLWSLLSRDKAVPKDWILQLAGEIADELMGYLLGSDSYPEREGFMAYTPALDYGDVIPSHVGPVGHVVCSATVGGTFYPATERALGAIEMVRQSTLDRTSPRFYYHIRDDSVIFFTGAEAKCYVAAFDGRTDLENLLPKHVPAVVAGILRYVFAQGGGNLEASQTFDGIYRYDVGLLVRGLTPDMPKPLPKEVTSS